MSVIIIEIGWIFKYRDGLILILSHMLKLLPKNKPLERERWASFQDMAKAGWLVSPQTAIPYLLHQVSSVEECCFQDLSNITQEQTWTPQKKCEEINCYQHKQVVFYGKSASLPANKPLLAALPQTNQARVDTLHTHTARVPCIAPASPR